MYHQKDCLWWFCDLGSELSYILSKTQKFFLFCINYMLWLYDQKLVKIFNQLNHQQLDTENFANWEILYNPNYHMLLRNC